MVQLPNGDESLLFEIPNFEYSNASFFAHEKCNKGKKLSTASRPTNTSKHVSNYGIVNVCRQ